MPIRLICTDIDGTLTTRDGAALHLEAIRAVRRAQRAGLLVSLVSGRPLPWVLATAAALGSRGPLVAENGGVVYWPGRGLELLGDRKVALAALELLRGLPDWREEMLAPDNPWRLTDCTVELGWDVAWLNSLFAQRSLPALATASGIMLHLHHREVDKGTALAALRRGLGLRRSQVMAIGDSGNDLAMLLAAGRAVCVEECPQAAAHGIPRTQARAGAGAAEAIRALLKAG